MESVDKTEELETLEHELECADSDYEEAHAEARRLTFVKKNLQEKIRKLKDDLEEE